MKSQTFDNKTLPKYKHTSRALFELKNIDIDDVAAIVTAGRQRKE
jgi:hypothetical protein